MVPAPDLYLPLQLNRLMAVGHHGQARFVPGVEAAIDDKGFTSAAHFLCESRRIADRACAALAMNDNRLAFVQWEIDFIQLGQRQVVRPEDLLPGMLIGLADVDKDRPLIKEAPGVQGAYLGRDMTNSIVQRLLGGLQ